MTSGRFGLSGVIHFFCLALFSVSVAAMGVGDTADLLVPDISYFPDSLQARRFTCRAVTPHAFWLVQDTTFIDLPDPEDQFQLVWGNIVTQAELDSISAQFEGAGVGVFNTVTSFLGPVPDTPNDDDRLWIAFADIRDYYPVPGSGIFSRLKNWVHVWPDDFDGDLNTGNNHDLIYVNIGPYKNMPGETWQQNRGMIHTWSVPTGLGQLVRVASNPMEEKWLVRGLGMFAQHLCYGLTSAQGGAIGIAGCLQAFAMAGGIELTSWSSGKTASDFGANLGGELLWLKYIEQRAGTEVIGAAAASERTGMLNIAMALDPSLPEDQAVEASVYPLYEDWLITNLVNHIAGQYHEGEYSYDFLEGTGLVFTIMDKPASFLGEFDEYPIPTWIAPAGYGISAQVFAAQYASFEGDYISGGNTTVHFNGMYNQNNGSGPDIDGRWVVFRVILEDDSTLTSVDSLEFDELFNGVFTLDGSRTFLVLTNANPGGTAQIRYALSQDEGEKNLVLNAVPNGMNPFYTQVFCSLFEEDEQAPSGFDWVGPLLRISRLDQSGLPDSTADVPMEPLAGTLWTGRAKAWSDGTYRLDCSGYDSLGVIHQKSLQLQIAFADEEDVHLEVPCARLTIPGGSLPTGTPVCLSEAGEWPGFHPDPPSEACSDAGTGRLLLGPVAVSPSTGVISFPFDSPRASVYRSVSGVWTPVESYRAGGRTFASVDSEGVYALGENLEGLTPEVRDQPWLEHPMPNPWRSGVGLAFSLPSAQHVSLTVVDLAGRVVAEVARGSYPGGITSLSWDGSADSGRQVPSGVYFVVLRTPGLTRVRRTVRIGTGTL